MAHRLPLADYTFIADFAAFCRSKGDEAYDYCSNHDCAIAQFLRASGRCENPRVAGWGKWRDADKTFTGEYNTIPEEVADACNTGIGQFDLLAARLESLLADSPAVVRS